MKTSKLQFSIYRTSFSIVSFLLIYIFIVGILFIPVIVVSGNIRDAHVESLQQKSLITAHSVVNVLRADIASYRNLYEALYETLYEAENYTSNYIDKEYYQKTDSMLQDFTETSGAAGICIKINSGDSETQYILSTTDPQNADFSATGSFGSIGSFSSAGSIGSIGSFGSIGSISSIGSIGSIKEAELQAFQQQETAVTELIDGPGGEEYTAAFVPITDPRDETFLGLAGAYYSAEQLHTKRQEAAIKLLTVLLPLAFVLTIIDHRILIHLLKENSLDHLTKLHSRKYLHRAFQHVMKMSNREHEKFGAAMLDIDHFKVINDNEGHAEGDRILTQISSLLQQNTREHDICIRLGGDEFVVLLPNCTEEQCRAIADRILRRTREIFSIGSRQVSVSIGLTVSSGKPNLHAVMKKADAALYQAKKRGRDQIAVSAG